MIVGVFRRIAAFVFDALPVLGVLSLLSTLFVGGLIKPDNYDEYLAAYQSTVEDYNNEVMPIYDQLVAEEITRDEYEELAGPIEDSYFDNDETRLQVETYLTYIGRQIIYYLVGFNVIYYLYNVLTKGRTLGRRITKIELKGKINWWTLLLREVIWKTGYWGLTLGVGILVDVFMIGITAKKLSFRDIVSQTRVTQEGREYQF